MVLALKKIDPPTPSVWCGGTKSIYVDPPGHSLGDFLGIIQHWLHCALRVSRDWQPQLNLLWSSPFQPGLVPPGVSASLLLAATCSKLCGSACPGPPSCDARGRAGAHADELLGACELTHGVLTCE